MRNWIDGLHFPEDARIHIREKIDDDALAELSQEQIAFLERLAEGLRSSEWSDEAIGTTIRKTAPDCGVSGREAYVALYWAMLGRNHGPKASSLLFEIGKDNAIKLLSS